VAAGVDNGHCSAIFTACRLYINVQFAHNAGRMVQECTNTNIFARP
jgi:hypothetical protein